MPFLVVTGTSEAEVNDQAKYIMGEGAKIHATDAGPVDYFQFNKSPGVTAPVALFTANVNGSSVWVRWVQYDAAP